MATARPTQPGPADPLLPTLGLPIQGFETAPAGIAMQRYTNQSILLSVPTAFPFPPGDQRLRAITRSSINPANRYLPLIKAAIPQGTDYGDAAAFIAFGTGPATGGKVLYIWCTLLTGPQGQSILIDTVSWIVNATLRPPRPGFDAFQRPDKTHVAFNFNAESNLDYLSPEPRQPQRGELAQVPGPAERAYEPFYLDHQLSQRIKRPGTRALQSGHRSQG